MAKKKKKQQRGETMQDTELNPQSVQDMEAMDAADADVEAVDGEKTEEKPIGEEEVRDSVNANMAEALASAVSKQEEYLAMAQRVQADFDNFRRRNQNVRKEAFDEGARAFATTLLPVIDNLERAIAAASDNADTSLKDGVEMVYRQLCEAFEKRGITAIDRKGQPFDPNLENAVIQGAPEDGEPGSVCEVLQKGYQMEGMVLRHAMVKVVPQ